MDKTIEQLTDVHKFLDQSNNDVEDSREGQEARAWARVRALAQVQVGAARVPRLVVWRQTKFANLGIASSVKRQVQRQTANSVL